MSELHSSDFELVLRSSSAAIIVTDYTLPDHPIVFANSAFTAITGYTLDEVRGRNCRLLQGPETDSNVRRELREAITSGAAIRREILNYRKSGQPFWNKISLSPVRDPSGTTMKYVGVQLDVTERRNLQDANIEMQTRFASIADNIPGYVFQHTLRPDGSLATTYVSPSIRKTFDLGGDDYQTDVDLLTHVHPDDRVQVTRAIHQSAMSMSALTLQFRLLTRTGERWVRSHSTPRQTVTGEVIWDGVGLDFTPELVAEKRLRFLASHDPLTGLQNRYLFRARLSKAVELSLKTDRELAVLKLDVKGFREINNTFGENAADSVIREIAQRLKRMLIGTEGFAARVGGDEFAIVFTQIKGSELVTAPSELVADVFAAPFFVAGKEVNLEVCIGATSLPSVGVPDSSPEEIAAELERQTDSAMLSAKQSGHGTLRTYSVTNDTRMRDQIVLRQSLRRALEEQQFTLHYQPLVELDTGALVGAEALVRWEHPELGLQRPDFFIPLAESSGLIVPLGSWVFREAVKQAREWKAAGLKPPKIAVNVSGVQLRHPRFLPEVEQVLSETGAAAGEFEFEVTESVLLDASSSTLDVLRSLKRLGFGLAVDDFGAGQSSFRYLRDYPFDKLKIDQLFVRQMVIDSTDASIIRAMVALAKSLDITVVAEGIETIDQRDYLRDEGCRVGQGYLYSRPLQPKDFTLLIGRGRLDPVGVEESSSRSELFRESA